MRRCCRWRRTLTLLLIGGPVAGLMTVGLLIGGKGPMLTTLPSAEARRLLASGRAVPAAATGKR